VSFFTVQSTQQAAPGRRSAVNGGRACRAAGVRGDDNVPKEEEERSGGRRRRCRVVRRYRSSRNKGSRRRHGRLYNDQPRQRTNKGCDIDAMLR
jgi:hypothetical protein